MDTPAVLMAGPQSLSIETLSLSEPGADDLVVEISHSGISTGTERLLWEGEMPDFPGMGYPLVPGYEAVGEVVEAGPGSEFSAGDRVFVPGASCYAEARGLFGASAKRVVTPAARVTRIDCGIGRDAVLLALAATARHALTAPDAAIPDLIVGHGVLGRLLARLTVALGGPPPMVWEVSHERSGGARGYNVCRPEADARRDYRSVYDASGDGSLLNELISRTRRGGEVVLAGFYREPLTFAYAPAFMRETRIRVAAEWTGDDMAETRGLVETGRLPLAGLITHETPASDAPRAYPEAFQDPSCLKMVLNWKDMN